MLHWKRISDEIDFLETCGEDCREKGFRNILVANMLWRVVKENAWSKENLDTKCMKLIHRRNSHRMLAAIYIVWMLSHAGMVKKKDAPVTFSYHYSAAIADTTDQDF